MPPGLSQLFLRRQITYVMASTGIGSRYVSVRKTRSPSTATLDAPPPATITAMYTASAVPRPPGVTGTLPASIPKVKAANTTARLTFEAGMPTNPHRQDKHQKRSQLARDRRHGQPEPPGTGHIDRLPADLDHRWLQGGDRALAERPQERRRDPIRDAAERAGHLFLPQHQADDHAGHHADGQPGGGRHHQLMGLDPGHEQQQHADRGHGELDTEAVVGLGAVVPATRGFFQDERATGGGTRHVLFETLVRIPLGTALPEEVIFRGSLLGLFTQRHSPAVAASMSSILFGAWHVLPTLRTRGCARSPERSRLPRRQVRRGRRLIRLHGGGRVRQPHHVPLRHL